MPDFFNGIAYPTADTQLGIALELAHSTVAAGSTGGELSDIAAWAHPSAGVLDIVAGATFPASGLAAVETSTGFGTIAYTGKSGTTLTGCTYQGGSPTGTVATGGLVSASLRGVAQPPGHWLPVKAPKYKPDLMLIPDETLQGSMVQVYDLVTGIRYDGHGWDAPPYLDTFPVMLMCEFGSPDNFTVAGAATTTTGAAAAGQPVVDLTAVTGMFDLTTYGPAEATWLVFGDASLGTLEAHQIDSIATLAVTLSSPLLYAQADGATVTPLNNHAFSLLNDAYVAGNQPPSATITDFDGEEWRQITAAQLDELTIKGNGTSLVEYTCTWFGNPATTGASVDPPIPTSSYSGIQTPAPWSFYSLIGGTYTPTVMDWEFDFKRNVKPIPALTGTQAYFTYFASVLTASGKLDFIEQSGSPELNNFLNAIRQSFDFSLFDQHTGTVLYIHASNGQFKTGEIDRSKEYVTVPVEFELLPSATDALAGGVAPCIVVVANAVDTAYVA